MHLFVDAGAIHTRYPGATSLTARTTPTGVLLRTPRPCFAKYRRRTFVNGRFAPGFVYDDNYNLFWRLGFTTPLEAPGLAAQGTGITGNAISYYTWAHYIGANDFVLAAESDLSPPSSTLALANQGRRHTLPTVAPDPRTNYKNVYVSMDGFLMRFAGKVPLAVATFDEAIATSALGVTPPVNSDGTLNANARTAPPYCLFCVVFHDRVWYAGDPLHPERLYYTLLEEGESVGPTAYIPTKGREAITGLGATEDQLVVFGYDVGYDVQGYSGGPYPDFTMRRVMPKTGCISHHGVRNINNRLFFPSIDGPYMFDGRPHDVSYGVKNFWKDEYKAHRKDYENSQGEDDIKNRCYRLLIPNQTPTYYYRGYYGDFSTEVEMGLDWSQDSRDRVDFAQGRLWAADARESELYVGGSDGLIRQENVDSNVDDDGDTRSKVFVVRPKHFFFGSQYGGRLHGRAVKELTIYVLSPGGVASTVTAWGGDDTARAVAAGPSWGPYSIAVPSGETQTLVKPTGLSGKGFAFEIRKTSPPDGMEYRGISVLVSPGPSGRR